MKRKKDITSARFIIPGLITSSSMFLGLWSIYHSAGSAGSVDRLVVASWMIILAACLDALDGRIARSLKAASKFGIQYDSLADVISFGVAPAILLVNLPLVQGGAQPPFAWIVWLVAYLYLVAGAARLARFNIQIKGFEKKNFTGLPIPAAAVIIASYVTLSVSLWDTVRFVPSLVGVVLLISLLMVSTIEYDTFPKLTLRTLKSRISTGLFFLCLALLIKFPKRFIFPFMMGYIAFGISRWVIRAVRAQQHAELPDEEEEPGVF